MTPEQIERWSLIRQKGITRFLFVTGVLKTGIPIAVLNLLL